MASMWRRAMVYLGLQDDDELDYGGEYETYGDYGDPAEECQPQPARPPRQSAAAGRGARAAAPREEPSGMSAPRPSVVRPIGPTTAARVHVVEPQGFNDAQEVGDRLKANQPVILNLQGLPRARERRLIDFSSGLAYAVA